MLKNLSDILKVPYHHLCSQHKILESNFSRSCEHFNLVNNKVIFNEIK